MRRVYLLAFVLVVVALPLVTRTRFRPKPASSPPVPVRPRQAPTVSAPSPAPDAKADSSPEASVAEDPTPTGWLNVRLDFGGETAPERCNIRVYAHTGIEKSEELPGAESVKIGPLTAGEKAVFVYSGNASFGAAAVVATVVDHAEVDVLLKLPKSFTVTGVVVDNTGRPVPGVTVEIEELIPLAYMRPLDGTTQKTASGGFEGGGTVGAGGRGVMWSHSFMMTSQGIRSSFDASTDDRGRFTLPHGASQPAVTLSIRRKQILIQQESRALSPEPLRLVIPVQAEEPKK